MYEYNSNSNPFTEPRPNNYSQVRRPFMAPGFALKAAQAQKEAEEAKRNAAEQQNTESVTAKPLFSFRQNISSNNSSTSNTINTPVTPPQPPQQENFTSTPAPENKDLIITANPKSAFAEAIKSVKTNILFSSKGDDSQVILITSPTPGDGKSFISANLAFAFAADDKKVLIIDADLRRGRQNHIFDVPHHDQDGYSDFILQSKKSSTGYLEPDQFIFKTAYNNISLLPSGHIPPNPLELLSSDGNTRIIERLRKLYDIIIIDCPPVLGLSDALVMSKYSDLNLVTITNDKTKFEQLRDTKQAFEKVNSKLDGVIMNRTKSRHGAYYSSYYTSKYYS